MLEPRERSGEHSMLILDHLTFRQSILAIRQLEKAIGLYPTRL